ncbi:bile-acid 7-alpha-dehydratase [Sphingomonas sp. DBB INV C78]|uniref:nuclear transport factor 2 family protein n=1 Tax=Sphingomonas sp. DBB INV C78 TaxID=3349434 RepID=UPI0036D25215
MRSKITELDLPALEQIRTLKSRYLRFVDTRDWDALASLFTDDAELEPAGTGAGGRPPVVLGPSAIVNWIRNGLLNAQSIHHCFMPDISLTASDRACGIWAMEDRISWPDRSLHGFGYYHDRYVRQHGIWLIAASRLERTKITINKAR